MFGIHHTSCPITLGLLDFGNGFGQSLVLVHKELTVLIVSRQVFQNFGKSGQHPSVATCPEVLLAVGTLVLGIDILRVAIIDSSLLIVHDFVRITDVFVEFVQILLITGEFVEFGHHGHYHIKAVGPPPIVILRGAHLILHHLTCTTNLVIVRLDVIEVDVSLETDLPVTEKHVLVCFTVIVLPFSPIVTLGALPLVVVCPSFGVSTVSLVSRQEISLHITRMVSGIVPEGTYFRLVVRLPIGVYLVNDLAHFLRLLVLLGCHHW